MSEMKVLTVRQPYAWAIIHGGKTIENRTRRTTYRGPVAIHAGLQDHPLPATPRPLYDAQSAWVAANGHTLAQPWRDDYGRIIGVADLVDVHDGEPGQPCTPWGELDAVHWVFENPRPLAVPLRWTGSLGLTVLPDDVVRDVLRRVEGPDAVHLAKRGEDSRTPCHRCGRHLHSIGSNDDWTLIPADANCEPVR